MSIWLSHRRKCLVSDCMRGTLPFVASRIAMMTAEFFSMVAQSDVVELCKFIFLKINSFPGTSWAIGTWWLKIS